MAMLADQTRAHYALRQTQSVSPSAYSEYLSCVKALPALIVNCGLGQAMATLLQSAKGDKNNPSRLVFDHVAGWLCLESKLGVFPGKKPEMNTIIDCDRDTYLRAKSEALRVTEWLKKFAVAYFTSEKEAEGK